MERVPSLGPSSKVSATERLRPGPRYTEGPKSWEDFETLPYAAALERPPRTAPAVRPATVKGRIEISLALLCRCFHLERARWFARLQLLAEQAREDCKLTDRILLLQYGSALFPGVALTAATAAKR